MTTDSEQPPAPEDLLAGGRRLWESTCEIHILDAGQLVQLEEACRAKDRCDELDSIIRGRGVLQLMQFRVLNKYEPGDDGTLTVDVKFDNVISTANATANLLKQLIAALRLPDEVSGKRPQVRAARGAYAPKVPGGAKVSSLDRARVAKSS